MTKFKLIIVSAIINAYPLVFAFGQNQISNPIGVVQFTKGENTWFSKSGRKSNAKLGFKSLLHAGDEILVKNSDSYLKVISTQGCIGVIYGESTLKIPEDEFDKAWSIDGGATRWICNKNQTQKVVINGHTLLVEGGELLYTNKNLLILNGVVSTLTGETFLTQKVYILKDNNWSLAHWSDKDIYELNQIYPAPAESNKLKKPKYNETSRWILTTSGGPTDFKTEDKEFQSDDMEIEGEKLAFHYKWDEGSLIGSLSFSQVRSSSRSNNHFCNDEGCQFDGDPNSFNSLEGFLAELGWRPHHERNWSWYTKVGFGQYVFNIHSNFNENCATSPCSTSYSYNRKEKFLVASLAAGVDYLIKYDWFGFYLAGELQTIKSVTHTGTTQNNDCGPSSSCENIKPGVDPAKGIMLIGVTVNLGLMLMF